MLKQIHSNPTLVRLRETVYKWAILHNALQQLTGEIGKEPIDVKDIHAQWAGKMKSKLPDEMVYADHWDFITELDLKKERLYIKVKTIQTKIY